MMKAIAVVAIELPIAQRRERRLSPLKGTFAATDDR